MFKWLLNLFGSGEKHEIQEEINTYSCFNYEPPSVPEPKSQADVKQKVKPSSSYGSTNRSRPSGSINDPLNPVSPMYYGSYDNSSSSSSYDSGSSCDSSSFSGGGGGCD